MLQSFSPPTLEQDGDTPSYGLLLALANVAVRGAAREPGGARSPSPSSRNCTASPGRPASAPPPDSIERRRLGLVLERVTTLLLEQVSINDKLLKCSSVNYFSGSSFLGGGQRPDSRAAVAQKGTWCRAERHHRHLASASSPRPKPRTWPISRPTSVLQGEVTCWTIWSCLSLPCAIKVWQARPGRIHEVCFQPGPQHIQVNMPIFTCMISQFKFVYHCVHCLYIKLALKLKAANEM